MKKEWFEKGRIIALPIALFVVFLAAYYLSQSFLVQCMGSPGLVRAGCENVNLEYIYKTSPEAVGNEHQQSADTDVNDLKNRKNNAERLGGRYTWIFSFVANVMVALGAMGIFLFILNKWTSISITGESLPKMTTGRTLGWLSKKPGTAICVAVAAAIIIIPFIFSDLYMPTTRAVFESTIQTKAFGIAGIGGLLDFANAVTFAATFIFVFALCVLAYPRTEERVLDNPDDKKEVKAAVDRLVEKKDDLRIMLYVATFLLVLCIFRMTTSFTWTLTFMTPESAEGMKVFFASFTNVMGGFFTLLLAATYLPAAYIVNKRGETAAKLLPKPKTVRARARAAVPEKASEPPEKKAAPDFKFSLVESLPRILAIAAPLLAGPLADMLKNLVAK